ncbi:uncharacterized protein LOC112904183 [Agrilus planipennis]|uniref:Uncharacterized protein LOC112904183 n=1 Tax=Agrilus planipennis TaxID=224129 RepID=A0A7F5R2U7_AGRPL|nr:uncharacterized protein LOC112904183 [Agrilus planipennis]
MNYYDFYYYSLCHVCKERINVKHCKKCKCVGYCSKEHQKLDWLMHKSICTAISLTRDSFNNKKIFSFQSWIEHRLKLHSKWRNILKRELLSYENQIWMFLPVCSICYSEDITVVCSECLNVYFCSKEHQEKFESCHERYCKELSLCMKTDVELFQIKQYPISKVASIPANYVGFPENNFEFLNCVLEENNKGITFQKDKELVLKYELIALSANILNTLRICKIIKERKIDKPEVVLHVVGACNTEITFDWGIISEVVFHYIINLVYLKVYLIGPTCNASLLECVDPLTYCCECINLERKVDVEVVQDLYHNAENNLRKPDFILLLNSGLHEFENQKDLDTWLPSISCLLKNVNVPILLTAYTKNEIIKDTNILKCSCDNLTFFLDCVENPFVNLRPFRDWNTENKPVFYFNNYITILKNANV